MAFDASSKWSGWEHPQARTHAYYKVTVKEGDNTGQGNSSDAQGVAWARVGVLSDGVADSAPLGSASNPMKVASVGSGAGTPLGYFQGAIATAKSLATITGGIPAGATYAIVEMEAGNARWRDDGTNPTGTVGMPIYEGQPQTFYGDLAALAFIQDATASAALLNISFYK